MVPKNSKISKKILKEKRKVILRATNKRNSKSSSKRK